MVQHLSMSFQKLLNLNCDGDEATGRNIVLRALEEPVRQIAFNAGYEGSVIIEHLKNSEVGTGFNAANGEWVNMVEAGIIDPVESNTFSPSKCRISCKSYFDN